MVKQNLLKLLKNELENTKKEKEKEEEKKTKVEEEEEEEEEQEDEEEEEEEEEEEDFDFEPNLNLHELFHNSEGESIADTLTEIKNMIDRQNKIFMKIGGLLTELIKK